MLLNNTNTRFFIIARFNDREFLEFFIIISTFDMPSIVLFLKCSMTSFMKNSRIVNILRAIKNS